MTPDVPLAARMRPTTFDEVVGQRHLVAPGAAFRREVEADRLGSVIFWGPPGVGKTTLAEVVARTTKRPFHRLSATSAGVADLRKVVAEAKAEPKDLFAPVKTRPILFIDEIHRFSKAQQDAILPHVEDGTLSLIGATTENPSFEVNRALLSRARVFILEPLTEDDVRVVIRRAMERELPHNTLGGDAETALVGLSGGDARAALVLLEAAAGEAGEITVEAIRDAAAGRTYAYDKDGDNHFDLISALHKSVRGSDPQAALYYLARMLEGGEDPMYVARRMMRAASEDIGLADPHALTLAVTVQRTCHTMGMPECAVPLAQLVVYLALAPKSNRVYRAYGAAREAAQRYPNAPVPLDLRNAPTDLMKSVGYGEGYVYDHDVEGAHSGLDRLPEVLKGSVFYVPSDRGWEAKRRE